MPFVTVKPKFQVTIPAKLRRGIDLHEGDIMEASLVEGDIMEASLVEGGILLRPKEVVDRNAAADRIASKFASAQPSPGDIGHSEDQVTKDAVNEITRARRERRRREG